MGLVYELVNVGVSQGYLVTSPATGMNILFDHRWKFNGNLKKPTFYPSMLVTYPKENPETGHVREHFFVQDGRILYLSDCNHDMAGKSVDMIECIFEEI